jgi:hypothetical protein
LVVKRVKFEVNAGYPCINAATRGNAVATDYDGKDRTIGFVPSRGAGRAVRRDLIGKRVLASLDPVDGILSSTSTDLLPIPLIFPKITASLAGPGRGNPGFRDNRPQNNSRKLAALLAVFLPPCCVLLMRRGRFHKAETSNLGPLSARAVETPPPRKARSQ